VKLDALANADGGDVLVALAVQGVVHGFSGWVKKDLFWHNFDDDLWHVCSDIGGEFADFGDFCCRRRCRTPLF
jgi:hypothetical protein